MNIGGARVRVYGMLSFLAWNAFAAYNSLDRKPPVTAGLIAANALVYIRPYFLHHIIPPIEEVFFNPYLIIKFKDLKRFLLSPFYNADESQLLYNMLSFLWKGIPLENSMKTSEYIKMVIALTCMSQGFTLLIAKSLLLFNYDAPYYENTTGFGGVLFAMKVVLDYNADNATAYGLEVPARYAAWLELLIVQMLAPWLSFVSHLGGILAGLLYVELKSSRSSPGPLTTVVGELKRLLGWPYRTVRSYFTRRRFHGSGGVGGTREVRSTGAGLWSCRVCTYNNTGLSSVCEMCGTSCDDGSLFGASGGSDTSLGELRRRRMQYYAR